MGAVYTQLSMQERRRIEDWWHAKVPVTQMARVLKRHKSTIFREIKRNFWADDAFPKKYAGYFGMAAHQRTQRRRSTQRKLIRYPELCQRIVSHLKDGWTPEQIGNRMIYEGLSLRVCHALPGRVLPQAMSRKGDDLPLHLLERRHGQRAVGVPARAPQGPSSASGQKAPEA